MRHYEGVSDVDLPRLSRRLPGMPKADADLVEMIKSRIDVVTDSP